MDCNRLLLMQPAVIIIGVFLDKWSSALLGVSLSRHFPAPNKEGDEEA